MLVETNQFCTIITINGGIMPLNLADIGTPYIIQKICGKEGQRHHLESLGLVENTEICILSSFFGYFVVRVKDSKIGIDKDLAKMIIVRDE